VIRYVLVLTLSVFTEIGCSRVDKEIREWRPMDHDQEAETNPRNLESLGQQAQTARVTSEIDGAKTTKSVGTVDGLADARNAWIAMCSGCHGQQGQGDGPRGAGVRATNLSDRQWQQSTSDVEIAKIISSGRGRMPSFELSPEATAKMIQLIRSFSSAK
jgi:mono/diheme cytochrome c family protein